MLLYKSHQKMRQGQGSGLLGKYGKSNPSTADFPGYREDTVNEKYEARND